MTAKFVGRLAGKVHRADGSLYLEQLFVADTWWTRFRGLQFLQEIPEGTGLLLESCRSVHTFWMRFPIHVIFLNAELRVVDVRANVRPWRAVVPSGRGVESVLEVSVQLEVPRIGEQITIVTSRESQP